MNTSVKNIMIFIKVFKIVFKFYNIFLEFTLSTSIYIKYVFTIVLIAMNNKIIFILIIIKLSSLIRLKNYLFEYNKTLKCCKRNE